MINKKDKRILYRLAGSAMLSAAAVLLFRENATPRFAAFFAAYLIIGYDILKEAVTNCLNGQVFDENFLMSIATVGAFCLGEYAEGVAVMIFYQVGELFQRIAVGRSRQSIAQLMDIRPDYANIERDGQLQQVDPEDVRVGEVIIVKPGEKIPLDAIVIEGHSMIDNSALTGESVPLPVMVGSVVFSGCVNLSGLLKLEVTQEFEQSTVAKILELVENASSKKAVAENFITKFARVYTPAVVAAAALLAILPPLLLQQPFSLWIERALIFLVISCPCALVISVPLSFFGGIGGASRSGILIKGGNYMEVLANIDTVVFDKTGTLTKGVFAVTKIVPRGIDEQRLITAAAIAEHNSSHPIARSITKANANPFNPQKITGVEEIAGQGVKVCYGEQSIAAGNHKLMQDLGITTAVIEEFGTVVHVAIDSVYYGYIVISDQLKESAPAAIRQLRQMGIANLLMLTGDRRQVGEHIAAELGLNKAYTELFPDQKVAIIEELLAQQPTKHTLAFIGDGINDAPVLSRADVGIAMGAIGSDAAIEAADVVLMDDNPQKIATAITISKKTLTIVKQNIFFALLVKAIILVLGAVGIANMWLAVFADVGVSVIAILNAMRALSLAKSS